MARVTKPVRGVSAPLTVAMVCVVFLFMATTPSTAISFRSVLNGIAKKVTDHIATKAYRQEEITLFDHYCTLTRRPYMRSWMLRFRSQVYCPGWTPVIGVADNHRNPVYADRAATQSFVRQALERGLVEKEQADQWL